jgi:hypothetical protein
MNYLSCIDAAKKLGVSTRRIQQMCMQSKMDVPGSSLMISL